MLPLRYDIESRAGFIRLREGRVVRTERLSPHAVAEYGRRGQLLTIALTDLEPDAAEFLRTADEETLLAVIERQAGGRGATRSSRPGPARPPRRRRG
jgi:hypothetical protein